MNTTRYGHEDYEHGEIDCWIEDSMDLFKRAYHAGNEDYAIEYARDFGYWVAMKNAKLLSEDEIELEALMRSFAMID